jgi:hypothetical protein
MNKMAIDIVFVAVVPPVKKLACGPKQPENHRQLDL